VLGIFMAHFFTADRHQNYVFVGVKMYQLFRKVLSVCLKFVTFELLPKSLAQIVHNHQSTLLAHCANQKRVFQNCGVNWQAFPILPLPPPPIFCLCPSFCAANMRKTEVICMGMLATCKKA